MSQKDKSWWINFNKDNYKSYHQNRLKELQKWIDDVKNDPDNEKRLDKQMCRYCHYHPPQMAFSAFTDRNCKDCEVKMTFPNSDTDNFCKPCAERNEVCKHCGAEID
jgi:hypothetical protein